MTWMTSSLLNLYLLSVSVCVSVRVCVYACISVLYVTQLLGIWRLESLCGFTEIEWTAQTATIRSRVNKLYFSIILYLLFDRESVKFLMLYFFPGQWYNWENHEYKQRLLAECKEIIHPDPVNEFVIKWGDVVIFMNITAW